MEENRQAPTEGITRQGLLGGISSVAAGVSQIITSLSRMQKVVAFSLGIFAAGGLADRVAGFPVARSVLRPLLSTSSQASEYRGIRMEKRLTKFQEQLDKIERKTDSAISTTASIGKKLDTVDDKLVATQVVVERLAKYTKTRDRILQDQDQERHRSRSLFGWGER